MDREKLISKFDSDLRILNFISPLMYLGRYPYADELISPPPVATLGWGGASI